MIVQSRLFDPRLDLDHYANLKLNHDLFFKFINDCGFIQQAEFAALEYGINEEVKNEIMKFLNNNPYCDMDVVIKAVKNLPPLIIYFDDDTPNETCDISGFHSLIKRKNPVLQKLVDNKFKHHRKQRYELCEWIWRFEPSVEEVKEKIEEVAREMTPC